MPESDDLAVIAANVAFYTAFAEKDFGAMNGLWSKRHVVACIHPGWQVLYGFDDVMASWRAILASEAAPEIEHTDARAIVLGDCAFVTCTERVEGGELVATNVFVRETEGWRLVHHQAGPFSRESPTKRLRGTSLN